MADTHPHGFKTLGEIDAAEPYYKRFMAAVESDPGIFDGVKPGPRGLAFLLATCIEDPNDSSFVKGYTDADHACWLGVSVRTIRRWAADLERAGVLRRTPRGYHLLVG